MKDYWKIISTWEIKIQISECIYWVFDVFCLLDITTLINQTLFILWCMSVQEASAKTCLFAFWSFVLLRSRSIVFAGSPEAYSQFFCSFAIDSCAGSTVQSTFCSVLAQYSQLFFLCLARASSSLHRWYHQVPSVSFWS